MSAKIQKLQALRRFLLAQVDGLTTEQLNEVPAGYANNIIWNVAHLGAAVQSICYVRAGLPLTVADEFFTPYLPGTRPADFMDAATVTAIWSASLAALDQLLLDVTAQKFGGYTHSERIQERYGVEVRTIDDALDFLLYHEGFHAGYVLALKHLVAP